MHRSHPTSKSVHSLRGIHFYRSWLQQKYKEIKNSQSEYAKENIINEWIPSDLFDQLADIGFWIKTFASSHAESQYIGYDLFNDQISLDKLYNILDIKTNKNKEYIKIGVVIASNIGLIESDDITAEKGPTEAASSLSAEGTEVITLPNPRRHPYIYIDESEAVEYLTHERWVEIMQTDCVLPTDGLSGADQFHRQMPVTHNWNDEYKGDIHPNSRIKQAAVAQAMIGLGMTAGVIDISNNSVFVTNKSALLLNEYWNTKVDGGDTLQRAEILDIMAKWSDTRSLDVHFEYLKYTNILYKKGDNDGYTLNLPSDTDGPAYNIISEDVLSNVLRDTLSYEAPESKPEAFDPDAYAVAQFINEHATVGNDDEADTMRVPVAQLMDAFDAWAKLNDVPLDDLEFERSTNMRKGKMKKLLKNEWNIEKASARMDGDIVRVYRPLELDSTVTKLAADIDTAA